jgi:hypothetical protein
MITEYVKENERLALRLLLGAAGVLAILTIAKLWDYRSSTANAQNIVSKAVDQDKSDPNLLKENLDGAKKIADAIKKENLFVPIPPKHNPVSEVIGIMGVEALINGKWCKAGDKIGDATVVAVEPTQVKIEWDGKENYFAPIASGAGASAPSERGGRGRGGESRGPRPQRSGTPDAVPERGPGPGGDMSQEQRAGMEAMRGRFESMSPEEREAFRNEMRSRFGGRGPGGGDGGGRGTGGPGDGMGGGGRGRSGGGRGGFSGGENGR